MYLNENPKVSLRLKYKKNVELGLVLTLGLLLVLFQSFKRMEEAEAVEFKVDQKIEVAEIEQTQQQERQQAPKRPTIPIESEDEDIPEDLTIESTEVDLSELPPPPPPPEDDEGESPIFFAYDEPPEAIGGYGAIQRNLVYPEIARKAGVEGKVIVLAVIDEKGNVVRTQVVKSLGNNGCDEAAIAAIRKTKWKPAMQRDKAVKVQISIPVVFKLK